MEYIGYILFAAVVAFIAYKHFKGCPNCKAGKK